MSGTVVSTAIITSTEAAARLGLTGAQLLAIIRQYRYPFTEIKPGGKPGDKGRNRWGLTEDQIRTILRGQERAFRGPDPEPELPNYSAASPDGISRARRGPRRR